MVTAPPDYEQAVKDRLAQSAITNRGQVENRDQVERSYPSNLSCDEPRQRNVAALEHPRQIHMTRSDIYQWHEDCFREIFGVIHQLPTVERVHNRRCELLEGPEVPMTAVPAFDADFIKHCAALTRPPVKIAGPLPGNAQYLRRLVVHVLYIDYGIPSPYILTSRDRKLLASPSLTHEEGAHKLKKDAYRANSHVRLPIVGLESMALLFRRFLDESTGQYTGSLSQFWMPQGPEALAFKLCYDWHVVDHMYQLSRNHQGKDYVPFSTYAANILQAAIIRAALKHLPSTHFWRNTLERWEEWHPEVRHERRRQDSMAAQNKPLVVYTPRPVRRKTCICM